MLRALIIDDEPLAQQELQYLLDLTGAVQILATGSNGIEAVELISTHKPDVVFLDVQMPGLDGFAVLKKLLDKNIPMPQVVFATAYDQYAVRAFEVNAVDYLLKPFDRNRVAQTVAKARARLPGPPSETDTAVKLDALLRLVSSQSVEPNNQAAPIQRAAGKVLLRAQNRLLLVDQKDICFASIEAGLVTVTTSTVEGQANVRTLEELLDQFAPETFWRVHRSFVVNLQHIREVIPWFKSSYQLRMDDPRKTHIPVARAQTKRLRELFNL